MPAPFPIAASKQELEEGRVLTPRFGADGLVTAVAADAETGEVLMVAHMNAEALARTFATGEAWYWSRSRGELWRKGATSGQVQSVIEARIDCDQDAVSSRSASPATAAAATPAGARASIEWWRAPLPEGRAAARARSHPREAVAAARALTDRVAKHDVVGVGRSYRERVARQARPAR